MAPNMQYLFWGAANLCKILISVEFSIWCKTCFILVWKNTFIGIMEKKKNIIARAFGHSLSINPSQEMYQ